MSKVFLCYRRDDSGGYAGRVQDRLVRDLGADVLFMDVDNIPIGRNFVKALNDEVAKCEVLLAVIGRDWLDARDEHGNRRLDDPNDFVRIEIAAALQRDIPVVPILLEGAKIPNAGQLPKGLEELSLRHGINVHLTSFHSDVDRLIRGLQKELNVASPPTEAERPSRVQEEGTKEVGAAEIKSGVLPAFGAIGADAAPTENKRLETAKLAAVCAIGGFLSWWLSSFLIHGPLVFTNSHVLPMAITILCGVASGLLRSRFRILAATAIPTIAKVLISYNFFSDILKYLLVETLCFFASIFVTIWLYEHLHMRANRQTSVPR